MEAIGEITALLSKQIKGSNSENATFYSNEKPEDIYYQIIYTKPPVQIAAQQAPTTNQKEEIESITAISQNNYNSKASSKAQITPISPYDFKQAYEIPFSVKPLVQFDSQLQNVSIDVSGLNQNTKIPNPDSFPKITTLKITGKAPLFNSKLIGIRSSIKRELPVLDSSSHLSNVPPIENDPFILEYLKSNTEDDSLRVIGTAQALAAIAVCQRSLYPFDLVFEKVDPNTIFVKIRKENDPSIQETSFETILASPQISRDKATQEFLQNIKETMNSTEEFYQKAIENMNRIDLNPQDNSPSTNSFIYRRIDFEHISFIVRGEIESIREEPKPTPTKSKGNKKSMHPSICLCRVFLDIPVMVRKPNEWDNIEQKRGTIFLTEATINSAKVARWTATAKLMGAEAIMLGYVTRKSYGSREPHLLLGVEKHGIEHLAHDIALRDSNMYGVLCAVFQPMEKASPGHYMFIKEIRAKRTFSIYLLPNMIDQPHFQESELPNEN